MEQTEFENQEPLPGLPSSYIFTQALVTQVLEEAEAGRAGRCAALGFTRELISQLQNLSPVELHKLFSSPFMWVKHVVDPQALSRILEKISRDEIRERLINRALLLGATGPMIRNFFGVNHNECADRRRMLGLEVKSGRIPILTEEQRISVWERWVTLVKQFEEINGGCAKDCAALSNSQTGAKLDELNQLDLMLMIAEEQNISVAIIWTELTRVKEQKNA